MVMMLAAALATMLSSGIGAPYPGARIETAPDLHLCSTRYRLSTEAGIAQVANFYMAEAKQAGVPLVDDTARKFTDYRTLAFIAQPKLMFVILDRKAGRTFIVVTYHTRPETECRERP